MAKTNIFLTALVLEIAIIFTISCAVRFGFPLFAVFYNLGYGLVISTIVPLYWIYRHGETLAGLGLKRLGPRALIVVIAFVGFSIGGQYVPIMQNGVTVRYDLLAYACLPLVMTTFFEEFLFRGFLQIRFERALGAVPAVLLSGLCFSLYHLGYPGFRDLQGLLLLFAVGIGFALAFKLSGNNVIASYLVNLPNALLTYALKWPQFPAMGLNAVLYAAVTVLLIIVIFAVYKKRAVKPVA